MDLEDAVKLYKEIVDRGCCKRCALRYLGFCRSLITFEDPDASLLTIGVLSPLDQLNLEPPTKKQKTGPCTVCLGVLEDSLLEKMLSQEVLAKCREYEHETFIQFITFPMSVLVRDHTMKIHLKRTFPEIFDVENVLKVNHTWRYTIEDKLQKVLGKKCNQHKSNLSLHFSTEYVHEEDEMSFVHEFIKDNPYQLIGRSFVMDLLEKLSEDQLSGLVSIPPKNPFYAVTFKDLHCVGKTIHLIGKYCKYSRELQQTPNPHILAPNISDMVSKAVTDVALKVQKVHFHVCNFDETQVRILGRGRTFHMVLTDPKFEKISRKDCKKIEKVANQNGLFKIRKLKESHKKSIQNVMETELYSARSYRLLCVATNCKNLNYGVNAINMYQTLQVCQKTPIRVIHQRPCWSRKKKIFYIKAKRIKDNLIEVDICAQSGLYIYEFVNGDMGRTLPSMASIMKAHVDVLATDILDLQKTAWFTGDVEDAVI